MLHYQILHPTYDVFIKCHELVAILGKFPHSFHSFISFITIIYPHRRIVHKQKVEDFSFVFEVMSHVTQADLKFTLWPRIIFFVVFVLFHFVFWERVFLCSHECPETCSGWPWTQRFICLCLLSTGIKGMCHHHLVPRIIFKVLSSCFHLPSAQITGITITYPTYPILCDAGDGTQDLIHARQAFYQMSYMTSSEE